MHVPSWVGEWFQSHVLVMLVWIDVIGSLLCLDGFIRALIARSLFGMVASFALLPLALHRAMENGLDLRDQRRYERRSEHER